MFSSLTVWIKQLFRSATFIVLLAGIYFLCWWLYRLDVLPGLHGDEAWFGLKAHQYNSTGIDRWYGMNTYSGILESLVSSWFFRLAGIGVSQLRLAGPVFNLLGVVIMCMALRVCGGRKTVLLFLLIFSQSALFLISPRVAWEVNTFTLFFIAAAWMAITRITATPTAFLPIWIVVFFVASLLGSYNHIIFSCISAAALGAAIMWSLLCRTTVLKNIILLLAFNLFNLTLLFIVMKYAFNTLLLTPYTWMLAFGLVVVVEIIALRQLDIEKILLFAFKLVSPRIIYGLVVVLAACFVRFHGMALYQVLSNYKIIMQAYSFSPGPVSRFLLLAGGAVMALYLVVFIMEDLKNKHNAFPAVFIVTYLGLLAVYTTRCSFRYYLAAFVIIATYLAFKAGGGKKQAMPLIVSLIVMLVIMNITLLKIFIHNNRPLKAYEFVIGNNQIETSAHFLPNKPLLDFLRENEIGEVDYLSNQYFLEQPILFYKLCNPWKEIPEHKALVDYDYSENNHGGYMFYRKE